jgi:hypothetical protein
MPGDASTLPPRCAAAKRPRLAREHERELARADRSVLAGALSLLAIVALSLFLVLVAANRPSLLSPTTHTGYFPRWMAGPLGGLLPGFTNNGTTLKLLFTVAVGVMYAAFVLALKRAGRLPVRWVIAAIVAVHAIFLLSPPLSLTDLFNYVNYGRMEVLYNLNPYTTIPILEPHSDPAFLLSNWHELLSPYGPLFTLITFAVVPLGIAGSFWALKCILVLTSLATVTLVWKCARLLDRDPLPAAVFAGLNPVVLVWGLGGDHNDFLMVFFIVLGFYLLALARDRAVRGDLPADRAMAARERASRLAAVRGWLLPPSAPCIGAGVAFVIAVGVKASAAVLVPIVFAGLLRAPRRLAQVLLGMLAGGIAAALASLIAFGLHLPDLSTQSQLVTAESIPNLLGYVLGFGGESAGVRAAMDAALLLSVAACCWWVWRRRADRYARPRTEASSRAEDSDEARSITAAGWASVALLVTLSWVLPWYVVWALPLAALSGSRRLRTAVLLFGVYLIVIWAPVSQAVWNALHFQPERTQLGRVHQRFVKDLLN